MTVNENVNEITTFLSAWTDAERSADIAFLDANLTDDFVGIGPLGFQLPKPAWVARHRAGDLRYDTFDLDQLQVRTEGAFGIVTARQTTIGAYQGHPLPDHLRDTLVLVKQTSGWHLAGIHMSFIAGTPGAPPLPGGPAPALPSVDRGAQS